MSDLLQRVLGANRQLTLAGVPTGFLPWLAADLARAAHGSNKSGRAIAIVADEDAMRELGPGDLALGRLDVLPTLDGVEQGLWCLERLASRGVPVLNSSLALRLAHDKLATAGAFAAARVPHPRTHPVTKRGGPTLPFPLVVKPRFGSWGTDVVRCEDEAEYDAALAELDRKSV